MAELSCPECGAPMVLRENRRFTYASGLPRKFFGCSRYPLCAGTHGAHPNGEPCGVPGNAATKAARSQAHAAFDRLWQGRTATMDRRQAYRLMQRLMGMTELQAHIAKFDVEQCETLIRRLDRSRPRFDAVNQKEVAHV